MSTQLSVIAGLGNPGERYEKTLHNAGFWFVDELARRADAAFRYEKRFDADVCKAPVAGQDVWLVKPQGFMNASGGPVRAVLDYYRVAVGDLLVAHDEIDLEPGTVRLKQGGGHGGHNGLRDIIRHCGDDFLRLRIGIGHPGDKDRVTGYVLGRAPAEIQDVIDRAVDDAVDAMTVLVERGPGEAMKTLHTRR